jgi:hypothetical protein
MHMKTALTMIATAVDVTPVARSQDTSQSIRNRTLRTYGNDCTVWKLYLRPKALELLVIRVIDIT